MRKYNEAATLLEKALSLKPEKRVEKYLKAINNLALSARKKAIIVDTQFYLHASNLS